MTRFVRTPEGDVLNVDLVELLTVRPHHSQWKLAARLASGQWQSIAIFNTEDAAYDYAVALQQGAPVLFEQHVELKPALDAMLDSQSHLTTGRVWS